MTYSNPYASTSSPTNFIAFSGMGMRKGGRAMLMPSNYQGDGSTLSLDFTTGVLDPRLTFSRASTATFVNSLGYVAHAGANLFLGSESLALSGLVVNWTEQDLLPRISAQPDPLGGSTATAFKESLADGYHRISWYLEAFRVPPVATISIFVKKINANRRFAIHAAGALGVSALFDLNDAGSIVGSLGGAAPNKSASITKIGNDGWYRVSATGTKTGSDGGPYFAICTANATDPTGLNFTGTSDGGLYLWGAQLNPGSTVQTYYPTTTAAYHAPRFDYSPTNIGEPRGLLVEGQGINVFKSSEELLLAQGYGEQDILSRTTGTSPSNGTAVGFYPTTVSGYHRLQSPYLTGLSGAVTVSIWYKRLNSSLRAGINANAMLNVGAVFDLNGAGSVVTLGGSAANKAATITAYPNDWYRVTVTGTRVTDNSVFFFMAGSSQTDFDGGTPFVGVASQGMLMWGAQLEAGSSASSYIPTGASQVTRTVDTCYMSGISSWYNESAGTVISNITYNGLATDNSGIELSVGTGSSPTNRIGIRKGYVDYYSGGVNSAEMYPTVTSGNVRIGTAYSLNDFAMCSNGGTMRTDGSGAVPVGLNTLKLYADNGTTSLVINGLIKSIKYFPTRLSNAQLQTLTTP